MVKFTRRAGGPKTLEDRRIFAMIMERGFGEITLELNTEQFAKLRRKEGLTRATPIDELPELRGWTCHFMQADCKTPVSGFIDFTSLESLRTFLLRCNPEDVAHLDLCISAWGKGSAWVNVDLNTRLRRIAICSLTLAFADA
jgi:hypothetical protein